MAGEPDLQKIAEGREAEIYAWEDGAVLRLMRSPEARQAVEWQAKAMTAAREAGVNVPAVYGVTTVQGRPGTIMERVDGPDMLTLVGTKPWTIYTVGNVSGKVHARMHEVRAPEDVPNLKEALRRRIASSELVPEQIARRAVEALLELPDGDRLCHGDFHPGNIIQTEREPMLIDWSNVTRGDPMADYARTVLMLQLGDPPPGAPVLIRVLALVGRGVLLSFYRRAYRRVRPVDEALAERWLLPVAANRLAEDIEPERAKLLARLESRMDAFLANR